VAVQVNGADYIEGSHTPVSHDRVMSKNSPGLCRACGRGKVSPSLSHARNEHIAPGGKGVIA